jgi:hypothetical protein
VSGDAVKFFLAVREDIRIGYVEGGKNGAGGETRTRDPNLGKVVLYQLSYTRSMFSSLTTGQI